MLLASASGFARRWAESLGPAREEEWRRAGAIGVYHCGEDRNRQLRCQLIDDGASYEDYPDFRQPALLFHGAHDDVVPARYSEHLVQILELGRIRPVLRCRLG